MSAKIFPKKKENKSLKFTTNDQRDIRNKLRNVRQNKIKIKIVRKFLA